MKRPPNVISVRTAIYFAVAAIAFVGGCGAMRWIGWEPGKGSEGCNRAAVYVSLGGVALGLGIAWLGARRAVWESLRKKFENREELSKELFIAEFFPDLTPWSDEVWKLWSEIGREVHVPCGKLRPSDDCGEFLSWVFGDEMEAMSDRLEMASWQLGPSGSDHLNRLFSGTLGDCLRLALAGDVVKEPDARQAILAPLYDRLGPSADKAS